MINAKPSTNTIGYFFLLNGAVGLRSRPTFRLRPLNASSKPPARTATNNETPEALIA